MPNGMGQVFSVVWDTNQIIGNKDCFPANIYLFQVNNRNTRKRSKICSELTIKTPDRRLRRRSRIFIVHFENISQPFLCSYCWLGTKKLLAGFMLIIYAECFRTTTLKQISTSDIKYWLGNNYQTFSFFLQLVFTHKWKIRPPQIQL